MAHYESTAQINTTTLDNFLRVKVEPIFRESYFMEQMQARGKILFGQGGKTAVNWKPRFRRRKLTAGAANPVNIPFPNVNVRRECELPWRHYYLGESIPMMSILQNQNTKTALFNIIEDTTTGAAEDFVTDFKEKLYCDGNAGTQRDIHGLESIFSVNGCVANSVAGNPNDSFAGHSTALGLSGTWTPNAGNGWPTGQGDTEYNWWSPLVVDYQNANFTGVIHDWETQWQQAIRFGQIYQGLLQKKTPDVLLLNAELDRRARDTLEDVQRLVVNEPHQQVNVGPKKLLFEDINIVTEYACPDAVGYWLNFDHIELRCMTDQLVKTMQDVDIVSGGTRMFSFQFFGNLVIWAPSFLAKLVAISALGT